MTLSSLKCYILDALKADKKSAVLLWNMAFALYPLCVHVSLWFYQESNTFWLLRNNQGWMSFMLCHGDKLYKTQHSIQSYSYIYCLLCVSVQQDHYHSTSRNINVTLDFYYLQLVSLLRTEYIDTGQGLRY